MLYDAIVVGAGPGGAATAAFMARAGLRVLLVDKDRFPRDKICGDAISGKSADVLRELDLTRHVQQASESLGVWGVTFTGPYGDAVSIPLTKDTSRPVAPGFVCTRLAFDALVVEKAIEAGAEVWQEATVEDLLWEEGRVAGVMVKRKGKVETQTIRAPLVVGADGAYSVVARKLGIAQLDERHYVAGLRAYYRGLGSFERDDYLELHFIDACQPGYFWIFPLPGGRANVGVGMLSADIKRRGIKLKPLLDQLTEHPSLRDRFANAERDGAVKGWGLPLGSKPRSMAGDGWMLIGDAASLIDPFTGEGIGNAMVSGMKAAHWAAEAHAAADFSAAFLRAYERDVLGTLGGELRLSYTMQKLGRWKWLLNTVIRKASRSTELADAISHMFDDLSERERLVSPAFYFRVLTA